MGNYVQWIHNRLVIQKIDNFLVPVFGFAIAAKNLIIMKNITSLLYFEKCYFHPFLHD